MGKEKFYITTTLPYVNAHPHVGFAMEIIEADVLARFNRQQGNEVFFNTGTDEHGLKLFRKAGELKMDVQDYVNQQAENFKKMLLTLSDDVRVILIKLADRLHNMRTLDSMSAKSQLKIASETLYVYAPLAHRLGLYAIKTELEDLATKYLEVDNYNFVKDRLQETKIQRNRYIKTFIEPIQEQLLEQGIKYEIKGRPKSIHSILNKMKVKF